MKTKQQLSKYLETPMNRQDFLKHLSMGILFVAGGGAIANALGLMPKSEKKPASISFGYGSSPYGGNTDKS